MIELKNRFVVKAIAKTSTRVFKDMKVDDVLEISVEIERKTNRRGSYATYYGISNLRSGAVGGFSGTELAKLQNIGFKFERI